jgi:hypothetical protein
MRSRPISHTMEGDLLLNKDTKDVYKVIHYQWTFCKKCSEAAWMQWCDESKDPHHIHYRYYVLENVRNQKKFEVSGDYLDNALKEEKIKFTSRNQNGYFR